jgi:hypothetical protein
VGDQPDTLGFSSRLSMGLNNPRYASIVNIATFYTFEIGWLVVPSSAVIDQNEIALESRPFGIFEVDPSRKRNLSIGSVVNPRRPFLVHRLNKIAVCVNAGLIRYVCIKPSKIRRRNRLCNLVEKHCALLKLDRVDSNP